MYALLGLTDDVIRAEIDPRYDEIVTETFVRTAKKLIGLQRSLYVLSQASHDRALVSRICQARFQIGVRLPNWARSGCARLHAVP